MSASNTPQVANKKQWEGVSVIANPSLSPAAPTSDAVSKSPKPSPAGRSPRMALDDEDLPTHVNDKSMLATLPTECLSGNPRRPLRHVDDKGNEYFYSLKPMLFSVALILVVELFERFSFYGIFYTQTLYLTGVYNEDWNAGLTSVDAASFVSWSTAVAFTTPFVGAILSDTVWGEYYSILIGAFGFYLPGILLVTLTSVPYLLGDTFNTFALSVSILFLWPLGTGMVKSVVNVFGAKQFHPILQSSMIERYYVTFYTAINSGALAGIIIVPIIAQHNVTIAYCLPCCLLTIGVTIFFLATPRYVMSKPRGDLLKQSPPLNASNCGGVDDPLPTIPTSTLMRITILIVPFCVAYSQMPTTFIVQGTVMKKYLGTVDAATMNGLDAISVLVFGSITGNIIYPALARREIKIPTTYKFATGSFLGSLAIAWALLVERWIHEAYYNAEEGEDGRISVLWQAPSYILIGWGEIFAVSAAYEVAFTASSPEKKALASALNIFCIGGIPNAICILLYQGCKGWFTNARGDTNLQHIEDYATASVGNYFWVLFFILIFGIGLNLHPAVAGFVESTEKQAAEIAKTPILRKPKPRRPGSESPYADEESPLISAAKNAVSQHYMKYAKQPVLNKLGSFRAGPSLSHKESKKQHVKRSFIPQLYGGPDAAPKKKKSTLIAPASHAVPKHQYNRHDSYS
jgi:POT family proton-dependent oligopeptide transporter